MLIGARLVIADFAYGLITTPSGDRYELAPLPNGHINLNHPGPRVGDTLIAVTHSPSEIDALTLVSIDGGGRCKLGIFLKSLAGDRSSN